jgi:hypothetical protein
VSLLTASRPAPSEDPFDDEAPAAEPEQSFGLFDQFADDFDDDPPGPAAAPRTGFGDDEPWPAAASQAPRPSVSNAPVSDEDLWGTPPPAQRRPIDPLINDGDFW